MKIVGERLKALRESVGLSQMRIARTFGAGQSSIYRYESGEAGVPAELLVKYADYIDVSMDYIFGRTDKPQGKLYDYKPKITQSDPEMKRFVEMCFDPKSPMNERLKETLLQMLGEAKE